MQNPKSESTPAIVKLTTGECRGWIFDPDRQGLVRTAHAQHKFSLVTRRCVRCNLHEFHLPAVPVCETQVAGRLVEEDGITIRGPEA